MPNTTKIVNTSRRYEAKKKKNVKLNLAFNLLVEYRDTDESRCEGSCLSIIHGKINGR